MKRIILISIVLALVFGSTAQANSIEDYYANPNPQTFMTAFYESTEMLDLDSADVDVKFTMAALANAEARRITAELALQADNFAAGGKFRFANLLLSQNRYDEALAVYDILNADYPDWSCPWRHKGEAFYKMGRFKEAEASFRKAIATKENHYDAYVWMAKAQFQLKKYKQALQNLEHSFTLDSAMEGSPEDYIPEESIKILHEALLQKTGKRNK